MQTTRFTPTLVALLVLGNALTAAAEPTTRPNLPFSFSAGQREVKIPLARSMSRLYAPVTLPDGQTGYFLVSTGASQSTITDDVAERLGLQSIGGTSVLSHTGSVELKVAMLGKRRLGPLELDEHPVLIEPPAEPSPGGRRICGTLAMDVIGRCPLTIDFRAATLTLHDPATFMAPPGARAVALRPGHETPVASVLIDGTQGWFQINTGFDFGFWLSRSFVRINPQLIRGRPRLVEAKPWDEPSDTYATWWDHVEYLGRKLPAAFGFYQGGRADSRNDAGDVGAAALVDASLTIDMASGRGWVVWLGPEPLDELLARLGDAKSVDLAGASPLVHAALLVRSDAVGTLLRRGDDPNTATDAGITPLMIAAGRGDLGSAEALVSAKASIKARSKIDGYTPLVLAAQYGRVETIGLLLGAGADINLPTDSGRTPLFIAADADQLAAAKLLIERGADVNKSMAAGETPLLAACRNGSRDLVSLLLERKADPNASAARGTALTYAAWSGSRESIRLLLDQGADPNQRNQKGLTPLIIATGIGPRDAECLRALLDGGADPSVTDADGFTAMDHAVRFGSSDAIKLLFEWQKQPHGRDR